MARDHIWFRLGRSCSGVLTTDLSRFFDVRPLIMSLESQELVSGAYRAVCRDASDITGEAGEGARQICDGTLERQFSESIRRSAPRSSGGMSPL